MPPRESHIAQAKRNKEFLGQCESCFDVANSYPEWHITIRFYVAVHLLDAILATLKIHPGDHITRNNIIYTLKKYIDQSFCNNYRELYNASVKARYLLSNGSGVLKKDLVDFDVCFESILVDAKNRYGIEIN